MELNSSNYNIGEFHIEHIKNNNLSIKIIEHNTTLLGKITKSSNDLLKDLELVLYQFDSNHVLVEVDRTKPDLSGSYNFDDVLIGNYVLKDTNFNLDNINANQRLASVDRANIVPWRADYNVANGYLQSGARLNDTKDKVIFIGGPNDGIASIYVYAIKSGTYDIEIEYIGGLRSFNLDINKKNTGEVYTTSRAYFGKILITVNLNLGYNLFKFYGHNSRFAPTLGNFTVNIVEQGQTKYNLIKGTLENGAKISPSKDVVMNLGGPNNGSAKIVTRVAQTGYYLLTVKYRYGGRPFLVDINDISTGEVYKVQTDYSGKFSFQVFFTRTFNELKFYGIDRKVAPNIGEFELTYIDIPTVPQPDPIPIPVPPTPIPPKLSYNVDQGVVSKGAIAEQGYVLYIGGNNDGRATVTVNVPRGGRYNIQIKYLYGDKPFKMDINQRNTGQVYRTAPGDSGTFNTFIELDNGENTIKFYGFYSEHASFLGEFTLDFLSSPPPEPPKPPIIPDPPPPPPEPPTRPYSVTEGILENGARISSDKKFVVFLGGQFNGSSTVEIDVNKAGKYILGVDFKNGNKPFKLDINGVYTGTIYRTQNISSGTFLININLNKGKNTIKFYGTATEYASYLGNFDVDFISPPDPPIESYSVTKGVLENGAILSTDRKFVLYLGGYYNGSSTVEVDVKESGSYTITIEFERGNRDLKLDINGVSTGSVYTTPNVSLGIFKTNINLNEGKNTIKFYGVTTAYASFLGNFSLDFVSPLPPPPPPPPPEPPTKDFSVAKGILESGAILSRDRRFVLYLGGRSNGSSTVDVSVPKSGKYNLTVDFQNGYRPLKLDVNGVSTGTVYTTPTGHTGKFKVIIDLNNGNNTIKFYGTRSSYASLLGNFTLDLVLTPLTPVLPPGTYDTANGIFENGAALDVGTNFVIYLGGINDGSTKLTVNVKTAGTYKVEIKYLAAESNRNLSVDVNGQNAGIYTPPLTNGWSLSDVKTFSFQVVLADGDNEIKFHGDSVNPAPRLGTFVVTPVTTPPTLPDYTYRTLNRLSYDNLVSTLKRIKYSDIPGSFNFNTDSYNFFRDENRVQAIINELEQSGYFFTTDNEMGIGTLTEVLRAGFFLAFYNNQLKSLDDITYRNKCLPAIKAIMDNSNFGFGTNIQDDVVENVASLIGNASADLESINKFVPLLEEFKNNIVSYANQGRKRVALYKIISQIEYFLNRERIRNGYNVQSTAFYGRIDSFIEKVEGLLEESYRILPDREDLAKNIIDGVGKLSKFRRDTRISQRALTNILRSYPYLSGVYLEVLKQIKNNFNSQLSDGSTINYDQKINEAKIINLPNTYRFDDGKIIIKTGNAVNVNTVRKLYWASKEVKAQFVRVTGNDIPLESGNADDILTMVIYNSPSHYEINFQLYGFSTDNGGIYQEEIGTFFTYDREVPEDSVYSLEELFRHEFVHYLFGRFSVRGLHGSGNFYIGNSSRLTWFSEGIAEFFAGSTRKEGVKPRRVMAQNLVNDRNGRLSLDILFSSNDGFNFYKYGFAFSYYMYTRNIGQFIEISRLIKTDNVSGYESYLQNLRADPTTNSSYNQTIDYLIQNVGNFTTPSSSDDYLSTHSYMTISQISRDISSIIYLTNIRTETKTSDYFETFTLRGTHDNGLSIDSVSDWNSINRKLDRALTELESKGWSGYKTFTAYFVNYRVDGSSRALFDIVFHGILRSF